MGHKVIRPYISDENTVIRPYIYIYPVEAQNHKALYPVKTLSRKAIYNHKAAYIGWKLKVGRPYTFGGKYEVIMIRVLNIK